MDIARIIRIITRISMGLPTTTMVIELMFLVKSI